MESKYPVNWAKIGIYFVCLGTLFMFWKMMGKIKDPVSDLREIIDKIEVKVEKLEGR